jgi:serine/threonine protein kinase
MAKQLGKYEIIRTLGQGAMGEVYLANHPTIGREVAIKTILPSASRGEDAEDRFRREALAAGNLNHPNLVTIYDFDKDGAVLYLVMEFVKGDDLEDLIAQRAMSQSQCLEVLAQICDGLSYAHRSGIIHRDIKPSNVRVVRDGKRILAKVMDFGIARIEDSGMTATGIVMGTVSYMAPEYIQSGKATALCDLWAVGVMLYECLSGRKPFQADNTTTILFKIVSETPQPVDPGVIQGVSPNVHAVLAKALAKDPEQRFQSADEFAKALRACKDPTWMGSIEDAMSKVFDRQQALSEIQELQEGTVQLTPSQSVAAASAPTVVTVAPTAVAPSLPAPNAPTMVMPSAGGPAPVPVKSGSKAGLYVAAGLGIVLLAGGGWYFFGRGKASEADAASANSAVLPAEGNPSPGAASNPAPAAEVQAAPIQGSGPANAAVKPAPSAPTPDSAKPEPRPEVKPEPRPEPPKPVEETPAQKLDKAVSLIRTNPGQAVTQLRALASSQPGDPAVQGNLLAALYRSRDAGEFERALDAAKARGLNGPAMMRSAPAFREAMEDERIAHRARNGSNVLPALVLIKVVR